MKNKFLLLFLMFSYVAILQGQQNKFNFRNINISDGLSNNTVSSIAEDQFGQIWFGTSNGLNKYNGKDFTVYRNIPKDKYSISNSEILDILVDKEGYIWVGTFNGLNRYNPKENTFKRFYKRQGNKYSLTNSLIISSLEMSNGDIWFGTANGISIYKKNKRRFVRFLQGNSKIGPRSIHDIYNDNKGNIWLATNNGVIKVYRNSSNKLKFKEYNLGAQRKDFNINTIIEVLPGIMGVGSKYHGYLYFNTTSEKFTRPKEIEIPYDLDVRDLKVDNDKNLWIATTSGLFVLNKENKLISKKENNIDNSSTIKSFIRKIYKSKNGFIWLGTQNGGVMTWDKSYQNFLHFKNQNLLNNITNSIVADKKGTIYFATEAGVVNVLNKKGEVSEVFRITNFNKAINYPIKSLYVYNDKFLFIGTLNRGIIAYNLSEKKVQKSYFSQELKELLENILIYDLKKDSKENLYIATFGKGLIRYNLKTKKIRKFARPRLVTNIIKSIAVDSKDNVLIGGLGGASKLEFNQKQKVNIKNYFKDRPLVKYNISAVFKDSNNVCWFGSKTRGLYRLDGDKIKKINISNRNMFYSVNSILEGEKGVLWLSTDRGIVKYNSISDKSVIYDQNSSIVNNDFRQNSRLKINDQFYFGDLYGITTFNHKNITKITDVPKVVLSKLKIKNEVVEINKGVLKKSLNYLDVLELNHNNSNFSISYALPNYINSKGNRYAYRLKGLDDSWTYTTQTEAFFTLQTAGTYTFQVKAVNHDNVWNTKTTNIKIIIHPAPWKTWWAYTIYLLLIFGLFYGISWIVQSKSRLKDKLELEYIANKKNEELNKAKLQFFTNISHEFRTPLTLIIGPLQNIIQDYTGTNATYKKLRIIESSTNHLLRLINRF